jgi:hypothetical protein
MSISKKLAAVDDSINALQHLQCVHFEMPNSTDKYISETISRLLKEKCYLEDKRKQIGGIRKKTLGYLKALFN